MTDKIILVQAEKLGDHGFKKRRIAYDKDGNRLTADALGFYHCRNGDWVVQSEWYPHGPALVFYCGYATLHSGNGLLLQCRSDWYADVTDLADREWLKFR